DRVPLVGSGQGVVDAGDAGDDDLVGAGGPFREGDAGQVHRSALDGEGIGEVAAVDERDRASAHLGTAESDVDGRLGAAGKDVEEGQALDADHRPFREIGARGRDLV